MPLAAPQNLAVLNVAAYKFVPLDNLPLLRDQLKASCRKAGLKGTILLSAEGINLFLAGAENDLRQWLELLLQDERFSDIHVKESFCDAIPFNRMLVKIKQEIIAFGVDGIAPHRQTSPKLPAQKLKQWLDEGRDLVLFDVRNDFEVEVGTFENAIPAHIDHFRDFEKSLDDVPDNFRDKPIVMFCTGGIRCEKAGPLMEQKGFQHVYQLDGGILKYFEECGGAHYRGDCFVFDGRVALDPNLQVSGLAQCFHCQAILSPKEQQSPQYVVGKSCPRCFRSPEEQRVLAIANRQQAIKELGSNLPGCKPHVQRRPIRISERFQGRTLLSVLLEILPQVSRQQWDAAFAEGRLQIDDHPARPARLVRSGEQYIHIVREFIEPPVNADIQILWEDDELVIVNKPAPLPVHPSGRFNHNTLLGLLNTVYAPEVLRAPHRLDANTSGVMVLCRRALTTKLVQQQFEKRLVEKRYLVRCVGIPSEVKFSCDLPLAVQPGPGRIRRASISAPDQTDIQPAHTEFEVLSQDAPETSLLLAKPISGRTNQIRAHLWELGFPVVDDPLYLPNHQLGTNEVVSISSPTMCLHAHAIMLSHPLTGERLTFTAPQPEWAGSDLLPIQ